METLEHIEALTSHRPETVSTRILVAINMGLLSIVFGVVSVCVWLADVGPLAGSGRLYSSMFLIAAPAGLTGIMLALMSKRTPTRTWAIALSSIGVALAVMGGANVVSSLFGIGS